ncbi:multicopper oxidase family protein [Magnetospirillum sulfuroxidans]|uniref:Multicopper oxidase family protein n=1 Tax=Magnetospirillum sulfuroxidans TaxID=611300 RepID=A0ABS5II64_9PROT|nr:multicopper oxidase family protein [Magnetospirillum sulfuroxidans]MBR9973398.1 multicopper oxidase family protein [Magnetospirillum sulfuroxidans]
MRYQFRTLSRRGLMTEMLGLAGVSLLPSPLLAASSASAAAAPIVLESQETPFVLPGCSAPSTLWSYKAGWPVEVRLKRGQMSHLLLRNQLKDHTSIHWHGVRVPLAMDGVPYITQDPVKTGDEFLYSFAPPDPGTFFFHPHCMTAEALGRGLAGVLVVEDPREDGLFDQDHTLAVKDWRVGQDGAYQAFVTDRGAARAGTFGSRRSINGGSPPVITVAPGTRLRLRLLNLDVTRIMTLEATGAAVAVIATDGNACPPFPVTGWRLGPAMRVDLALTAPTKAGTKVLIQDSWGQEPFTLATVVTEGVARRRDNRPLILPAAELPEPDLSDAQVFPLSLQAGVSDPALDAWLKDNRFGDEALCRSDKLFWAINGKAWPAMDMDKRPPPLAELKSGRTYVAEIANHTQHPHPVHLHGHTFRVESSSRGPTRRQWVDTVLAAPDERVRIAFVAGEPGDWMLHCHIIEHQETGMMGYIRVT